MVTYSEVTSSDDYAVTSTSKIKPTDEVYVSVNGMNKTYSYITVKDMAIETIKAQPWF